MNNDDDVVLKIVQDKMRFSREISSRFSSMTDNPDVKNGKSLNLDVLDGYVLVSVDGMYPPTLIPLRHHVVMKIWPGWN